MPTTPVTGLLRGVRTRSLATQMLLLQLVLVGAIVAGVLGLAFADAQRDQRRQAEQTVLAVATTVADAPVIDEALATARPTTTLQPYAEQVRTDSHTDFVVVMSVTGTRYSHPDVTQIGGQFRGSIEQAARGQQYLEEYTGTLGPSVRSVVPVLRGGRVVALVSVGITTDAVQRSVLPNVPSIVLAGLGVLALGAAGAWLIGRRLDRQAERLAEDELRQMADYYDAVLHSVREGLVLLDRQDVVRLVNDEAVRLLGLPEDAVGRPVGDLGMPVELVARVTADDAPAGELRDETFVVGERVLVVNRTAAQRQGRLLGSVVTLRDRTDLQRATGELAVVRGLAESLRSQTHEAANRLHTVVSLVELGRADEAVDFATHELELAQRLTDRVVVAVDDPVLAALMLGKTAQAAEQGVRLVLRPDTSVRAHTFEAHDLVTILGNLVDNALDAPAGHLDGDHPREVEVLVEADGDRLHIRVGDSGPGLAPGEHDQVFRRGWSTKAAGGHDRGIGLALVRATVLRLGGQVSVDVSPLGGAEFDVRVGAPVPARPRSAVDVPL
ncbi:MAG: sensor histidine kinase [Lapillicoccus sp.]